MPILWYFENYKTFWNRFRFWRAVSFSNCHTMDTVQMPSNTIIAVRNISWSDPFGTGQVNFYSFQENSLLLSKLCITHHNIIDAFCYYMQERSQNVKCFKKKIERSISEMYESYFYILTKLLKNLAYNIEKVVTSLKSNSLSAVLTQRKEAWISSWYKEGHRPEPVWSEWKWEKPLTLTNNKLGLSIQYSVAILSYVGKTCFKC
jgi:hypothetical protein